MVQYNTELARLELETGSILEAHGIAFYEERYGSIGPLGRHFADKCYPRDVRPTQSDTRYDGGDLPAENQFELTDPLENSNFSSEGKLGLIETPGAESTDNSLQLSSRRRNQLPPPVGNPNTTPAAIPAGDGAAIQ